MHPTARIELDRIREDQDRLHHLVGDLDRRIESLGRALEPVAPAAAATPVAVATSLCDVHGPEGRGYTSTAHAPTVTPPPLPVAKPAVVAAPPVVPITTPAPVAAMPAPIAATPAPVATSLCDVHGPEGRGYTSTAAAPVTAPPVVPTTPVAEEKSEPLELRLGTYWMSRIGIVILLTGLVFLGNFAYQKIVPLIGPGGKLALLTLAGVGLAGLGAWMERTRETLRNYARVLMAGGAATLYYTAYAAHFVERLRVIESPLAGGALLLALAGGILWFAERRRSESIALLAVMLSYYTSAINAVGGFTLFSNVLLTATAVYFLVRHRWLKLSFASLVGTYGSYVFWIAQQAAQVGWAGDFGAGLGFVASYWVLFTAAVFLVAPGALPGGLRAAFASLNNGAFFAFGAFHFAAHQASAFWMFALGYGAALLALAVLAARRHQEESSLDAAYLMQGLALVTIGFAAKLTGPQLAVVLAVQSNVLLANVRRRHGWIFGVAAALCALAGGALAVVQVTFFHAPPLALGGLVAGLLLLAAWWVKYVLGEWRVREFSPSAAFFAILGLSVAGVAIWEITPAPWQPAALAGLAVTALLARWVRLLEITLPAQALALISALVVLNDFASNGLGPWWTLLPVVVATLVLLHWWQRQSEELLRASTGMQFVFAGAVILVGAFGMHSVYTGDAWLAATSAVALLTLLYGWLTRAWVLALCGQVFTMLSLYAFLTGGVGGHPHAFAALTPVLALVGTAQLLARFAAARWPALPEGQTYLSLARPYAILAQLCFAIWSWEYVPAPSRAAFFLSLGAAQLALGAVQQHRARSIGGALYALVGLATFAYRFDLPLAWVDAGAIGLVIASLYLRPVSPATLPAAARYTLLTALIAGVWLWSTRWTIAQGYGLHLTTAWTLLALTTFAGGLLLRERLYRLAGFALLALAGSRLFFVDVWRFDTLYRIVSFLVLGAGLLALSFVYHRFAETLRRWL